MASQIIGRSACPECGFSAAHVKKSDKCHYRYCPECGAQHHARTERQVADLLKKTRLSEPTPTPTGKSDPAPTPSPSPTPIEVQPPPMTSPTPAPRRHGLGLFQ